MPALPLPMGRARTNRPWGTLHPRMRIRPASSPDIEEWLRMRRGLWPTADAAEMRSELPDYLGQPVGRCALVAEGSDGQLCGFIELSLRNIVDGCDSTPVGYIEGWFVDVDSRKRGIGRALVAAGEAWAREQGCTEMGSDTEIENVASEKAHRALGYQATGRVITFRRSL